MSVNNESVFRWVPWRKARGNIVLPCRPLTPYETHVVVERQLEWVGTELPLKGNHHLLFPASGCRLLLASVHLLE